MNKINWNRKIADFCKDLDSLDNEELIKLQNNYPYFSVLTNAHLKNIHKRLPESYASVLANMSYYILDGVYFMQTLIQKHSETVCTVINGFISEEDINSSDTGKKISELACESKDSREKNNETNTCNLKNTLENNTSTPLVDESAHLIEQFMKTQPTMPRITDADNDNKAFKNKAVDSEDDLFSETLANIYIKQGLFDKAITTYIKLSLKFPEKSVYFANQIESIKEKINT